jgi:hypothetical protein
MHADDHAFLTATTENWWAKLNQFATICGVLLPSHAANMAGSFLWSSPQHSAMERRSTVQAATASLTSAGRTSRLRISELMYAHKHFY